MFFTSEQGKFQAWLPLSQSVQEYSVKKTLFGETIACPRIVVKLNSAYAIVQYCDLAPDSIAALSNAEILDQARGEVLDGIHAKLERQQRVTIQDTSPALTLSGPVDMRGLGYDGTFKAKIILTDNRIYLIAMNVHHENWCKCLHQIDQVVGSLYIEPDLSIPFESTP